ncbi:preprotein translocase subunit SecA [Thiohalorhabdus denitrificans]|uniref:Protein translocase subunit SecA n=1 Tax=Thiohalorhabdus denitrificans TaxID=381306 RepID=A0A0P9EB09_9GAMM|nr:preprotein translocase subunit SecA [Thiohalorhabdus denitrificans]KPV39492.1 preprotein translocase subunit SecA [Thiohalorhabdus denitrificans]SCY00900.1 protein translocase subunit secA [Thiohalorhabdus denitrificans]
MLTKLIGKTFGTRNERLLKRYHKLVERVNEQEEAVRALSDQDLAAQTERFRERLAGGEKLDDLLPEAFATVREASYRVLGMRHFDVQLIGGMVLHDGKIAEMKTGEGKTLVATLPAYLNALPGEGVHVVTVNDYLAGRDAEWMGQVYRFLGLSVGTIRANMPTEERQQSYACDITYGTNNEFGFDFLRDNMAFRKENQVQREHAFAIVDEVDSILIDEARTPLIISGPTEDRTDLYYKIDRIIPNLEAETDYAVDEKARQVTLTEDGNEKAERLLDEAGLLNEGDLYDAANVNLVHHVSQALRAHALFTREKDYIVRDNQVVIIDEFTGRMMPGRRWSDGLHQAVEAKEGVEIQNENQTLASITFQNYFRLYDKLSGMTGTADTEAVEFKQIYDLEVVVVPTHKPMVREDLDDVVYRTKGEKFDALVEEIRDCYERGQPVLVGTASIAVSEELDEQLNQAKIPHNVLNAKFHEKEAEIIAQAGRPGTVTIATNMAGRGTDIVLGGNLDLELRAIEEDDSLSEEEKDRRREETRRDWQERHDRVVELGGLHIVGTERNESRRIDNQLRGRAGRQGDPGASRFFLSLEDDLMRIFASERVSGLMQRLGMPEGEPIEHPWVNKAISNAQRKVEGRNFDIRKQLLEYDDVNNQQRQLIYEQRRELMESEDISDTVEAFREAVLDSVFHQHIPPQSVEEEWDTAGLEEGLYHTFGLHLPVRQWLEEDPDLHEEPLKQKLWEAITDFYREKEASVGPQVMREFEKVVALQVLDTQWKDHLAAMDHLKEGIHLRGYAQRQPVQEYKREAFSMFEALLDRFKQEVVELLYKVQVRAESDLEAFEEDASEPADMEYQHPTAEGAVASEVVGSEGGHAARAEAEPAEEPQTVRREGRKVGRNEPCPCGSGKKYKQCHGKAS